MCSNMSNHLIVLTLFVLFLLGFIPLNQQVLASSKHEDSEGSNEKQDKKTNLSNDHKSGSTSDSTTDTSINKNADMVTVAHCSNGSDKNTDKICANASSQKQTTTEPQNTQTPQLNPIVNTNPVNNPTSTTIDQQNQAVIDNLIAAGQDSGTSESNSGGGSSGGSSSSTSNDDQTDTENKQQNHDNDKFVLIADNSAGTNSKIGLFLIKGYSSDTLDTSVLPKRIHGLDSFPNIAEATNQINEWDNENDSQP
jgi:hypothetical protein